MPSSESESALESETFGQDASFRLEQPIGAMSISPSGRDVVLASKDGLHIIDLDSPYSPPRYLQHRTPWEVADVQWSPFARRDYWVVSTSNQKALVWNLEAPSWLGNIEMVLHGHTRAITDINFSAKHPDILATCGVDSFVHCWDLRAPLRPAVSFSDWFAGATQVKYSRQDEHVLASSHDRFLHIWDDRKGAIPLRTIEAHETKIYGIDWNRFEHKKLITCSLDRTIKFWDCDIPDDVPERIIHTPFPVWRARHTPFGWGVLAMPQRSNSDLHLYDRRSIDDGAESGNVAPVAVFPGHKGTVKEFLWRAKGTIADGVDQRDFQLVTWGSDRQLRLHRVEEETFNSIGYEKGVTKVEHLNFTRRGARYRTFREEHLENVSPVDMVPNADMLPSSNHILRFRHRTSTTTGMSKLPVAQFRGWVQGQPQNTRMGMHGRSTVKQNNNALAWLRNVKINTWDPDTLAEEITQVSEKFKKVEFESIDIARRRAVMSVYGPWGNENTSLYIRVDMRFPKFYPRTASAVVTVQKTTGIDESVYGTLVSEIQIICETCAVKKKGCLEAVIRYLLREQTLDIIIESMTNDPMLDSRSFGIAPQVDDVSSSSDEDDRIEAPDQTLDVAANSRVPVPKGCGALFAENGMLVCFFPERPKQSNSTIRPGAGTFRSDQSSARFEGFGRLRRELRPANDATLPNDDDSGSTGSDELSDLADSSSTSSTESLSFGENLGIYAAKAKTLAKRSRSADVSNRSTTLGGTRSGDENRSNYVCLHFIEDLLPSQRRLAESYRILGPGTVVCKHNAMVAEHAGLDEIASVWHLANLVLEQNVPLVALDGSQLGALDKILVTASRTTPRVKEKDSAVDLSFDDISGDRSRTAKGRTRWGQSPLSSGYLIYALFSYFDQIGDIQMLAMLSCIFAEPTASRTNHTLGNHAGRSDMAMSAPAYCPDYFPSSSVAQSLLNPNKGYDKRVEGEHYQIVASDSHLSDGSAQRQRAASQTQESLHHYNTKLSSRAPSVVAEDTGGLQSGPSSITVSLSTSPEDAKLSRQSATSVPYTASRASLQALSHTYSHSPPSAGLASSIKKFSPSASSLAPSSWVSSAMFRNSVGGVDHSDAGSDEQITSRGLQYSGSSASLRNAQKIAPRQFQGTRTINTSSTPRPSRPGQSQSKPKRRVLVTSLHNQNKFDIDGYASVPLLEPRLEERYRGYRASYAHLLGVWQLPHKRAELLKFDGLQSYFKHFDDNAATSPPATRKKPVDNVTGQRNLHIKRCCPVCGEVLAAIERNGDAIGWHCTNELCVSQSRKTSSKTRCVICERPIAGLSIPCLQCGHTTCYECGHEWYRLPQGADHDGSTNTKSTQDISVGDAGNDLLCAAGCGCTCSQLPSITVPDPASHETPTKTNPEPPPSLPAQKSQLSARSERLMSTHGPDKAIGAFLAMSRAQSTSAVKKAGSFAESAVDEENEDDWGSHELHPWASSTIASLGRGIGAGLSRGLASKASDATIRRGK